MLAIDAGHEGFDLGLGGVVDAHGDGRASGGGDHFRGFVDRFGPAVRGRLAADAAARAVDGCAGLAECAGDAAAGAARGAGDKGDTAGQRAAAFR